MHACLQAVFISFDRIIQTIICIQIFPLLKNSNLYLYILSQPLRNTETVPAK